MKLLSRAIEGLEDGRVFYWRVDAILLMAKKSTPGEVWSFTVYDRRLEEL